MSRPLCAKCGHGRLLHRVAGCFGLRKDHWHWVCDCRAFVEPEAA